MKKIVALGASNSKNSINKKFANWAAHKVDDAEVEVIDLNDYEMPIYNPDFEQDNGIPDIVSTLKSKLNSAEGYVVSLAEHNGNYTAAFKNAQDWLTRIERNIWGDKPMLLMATSPGKMGGISALNIAKISFPYMGANVVADYSLAEFYKNFNSSNGISDSTLSANFETALKTFKGHLENIQKNE